MFKILKDELGDIVAIGPGEINIEIGRIGAKQIDKTFKIQIQFHRIYIGNTQQIRHNTIGTTTATYIKIAFVAGVF